MWRERALRILREGERAGACGASRRLSRRDGDGARRPCGADAGWKRGELGLSEEEYESYGWAGGRSGGSAVGGMFGRALGAASRRRERREQRERREDAKEDGRRSCGRSCEAWECRRARCGEENAAG